MITPLHLAILSDHEEIVQCLLKASNIDINAQDDEKNTALHLATEKDHVEFVQALLSIPSININAKNIYHLSALHLAAAFGNTEIVLKFLHHDGIDIALINHKKTTALYLAAKRGHTETVQAFLHDIQLGVDLNKLGSDKSYALEISKEIVSKRPKALIFTKLLEEGYFQLNEQSNDKAAIRFFQMMQRLPVEIQMRIINRLYHSKKDFIPTNLCQEVLKSIISSPNFQVKEEKDIPNERSYNDPIINEYNNKRQKLNDPEEISNDQKNKKRHCTML